MTGITLISSSLDLRFIGWITKLAKRVKEQMLTLQQQIKCDAASFSDPLSSTFETVELLIYSIELYQNLEGSWDELKKRAISLGINSEDDNGEGWYASSRTEAAVKEEREDLTVLLDCNPDSLEDIHGDRKKEEDLSGLIKRNKRKAKCRSRYNRKTKDNLTCDLCGDNFERQKELEDHRMFFHATEGPSLIESSTDVIVQEGPNKPNNSQCPQCEKVFHGPKYVEEHIRRIHEKALHPRIPCDLCGKDFASRQGLVAHKQLQHQIMPKQKSLDKVVEELKCCNIVFKHRASFRSHVNRLHSDIKPDYYIKRKFVCPHCGEEKAGRYGLKEHIERVHEQKKKGNCSECGKGFARMQDLKKHIDAVHKKLKPYQCDTCGNHYSTKENRDYHIKHVHKQVKNFKCESCNSAFVRRRQLELHMQNVHSSHIPFEDT